jgi:hypothetical protein
MRETGFVFPQIPCFTNNILYQRLFVSAISKIREKINYSGQNWIRYRPVTIDSAKVKDVTMYLFKIGATYERKETSIKHVLHQQKR